MTATPTTKLGLLKPASLDPQDIAVLNANFDRLDKFASAIVVNPGVTPPDADLFDGAIVIERGGVVPSAWVAQWNGTGYSHVVLMQSRYLGSSNIPTADITTGGSLTSLGVIVQAGRTIKATAFLEAQVITGSVGTLIFTLALTGGTTRTWRPELATLASGSFLNPEISTIATTTGTTQNATVSISFTGAGAIRPTLGRVRVEDIT